MAPGRFLFKSDDPELQHITLSLEVGISSYQTYEAKVFKIIDGDTLQVLLTSLDVVETVRLLGIDAPETGSDEHAKRHCRYLGVDMTTLHILAKLAGIHLQGLLPRGTAITLKTTSAPRDDRNRILAGVLVGDACMNRLMVDNGYALTSKFKNTTIIRIGSQRRLNRPLNPVQVEWLEALGLRLAMFTAQPRAG